MGQRFLISESEKKDILGLYEDIIRPYHKLIQCKFSSDGKVIVYENVAYSTETGEELPINEGWSLSDILHAGADVLSAGLDFVIPGSGAIVDILNGLSYIIEAQFKSEAEKDSLYLMAAVTFAFVVLPGPLQTVAVPLKQFLKGGAKGASKLVLSALKVVGGILDKVLLGIPKLINKALSTKLGKGILGKWGKKISDFFSAFSARVKNLFNKMTGGSAAQTVTKKTLTGAEKLAVKSSKLTPKALSKMTVMSQKLVGKIIGNKAVALKALGFKPGKMYRYLGKNGKMNTVYIKEIKPDGTVIGLFGKKSGDTVLGTQAAVPAETFLGRGIGGPWGRRGSSVMVPLFVKRMTDAMRDDGTIDANVLAAGGELNADEVSAASLEFAPEDVVADYQGDTGQYDVSSNVTSIQNALMELDPNSLPKFGADGKFGPETLSAIEKFQKDNGLTPNKKADKAFVKKLIEKLPANSPNKEELNSLLTKPSEVKSTETDAEIETT